MKCAIKPSVFVDQGLSEQKGPAVTLKQTRIGHQIVRISSFSQAHPFGPGAPRPYTRYRTRTQGLYIMRYNQDMANEIRDLREAAGLSQSELARRSGVAQPNIAAYESGRRIASPEMIERIRKATRPLPHESLILNRQKLQELAASFGLINLRIFGSAMSKTDRPDSDVDLLVSRPQGTGLLTLAAFAEAAQELLGVEVDVVTDGGLPPDHEIMRTAVAL